MGVKGYVYYVRLEFPEFPDPKKPMGLYRAPGGVVFKMEVLGRDGLWHYSEELSRAFLNLDTLTVEEVGEETALKAARHLIGRDAVIY